VHFIPDLLQERLRFSPFLKALRDDPRFEHENLGSDDKSRRSG